MEANDATNLSQWLNAEIKFQGSKNESLGVQNLPWCFETQTNSVESVLCPYRLPTVGLCHSSGAGY